MKTFKALSYSAMFAIISLVAYCKGCSNDNKDDEEINIVGIDELPGIIEVEGIAGDGTSMNVLELITDNGDTISISTPGEMITGGINCGDRINVVYFANEEENLASVAINLTALQHLWTQKGADGHSQSLELNEGGRAITYNMNIDYIAWELKDGQLLLHSSKSIASEKKETVDTFQIMNLTDEQLVLANHNIETIFELDN